MIAPQIHSFVQQHLGGLAYRLDRLAGDASTRVYYRIQLTGETWNGRATLVLMHMGEPEPDPVFVSVQKVLRRAGAPVPEIFVCDPAQGLMLLEDFGDVTLEQAVAGADRDTWIALYARALDVMARIQFRGPEQMQTALCVCFSLAFDVDKLMFEMDFFVDHVLKIHRRAQFGPGREQALRRELETLCRELSDQPRYLCHRDYHSRNLMVLQDATLGVIDFQDARMGPLQYDLVSLLHDSYVDMPAHVRDELYGLYLQMLERELPGGVDAKQFRDVYNLMLIQRNLKAAGSFAYLDCVKNMGRYLARLPQCLAHVRAAFDALPRKAGLRDMLLPFLPELATGGPCP